MIEYDLEPSIPSCWCDLSPRSAKNDLSNLPLTLRARQMATLLASLSAPPHSRGGTVSGQWSHTSASCGTIKSTSNRSQWSPTRTLRMWPSIWDHTLCQPGSNIFPPARSNKRDSGLSTARNALSRKLNRRACRARYLSSVLGVY